MRNSVFNLSDDLVKNDIINLKNLKRVQMLYAEDSTVTIEQALVKEGLVTEEQIYQLMADKMHLPLVDLDSYYIEDDVLQIIPDQMMEDLGVMPLTVEGNYLLIAMTNPLDYKAIYTLNNYTKRKIKTAVCTPSQLEKKRNEIFSVSDQEAVIDEAQEFVQSQMKKTEETVSTEGQEDIEDQPIIKFVNNMISEAVRQRVSDIHLEPQETKMVIRFRVDGKLIKYMDSSKELAPSVTSRIKFISGMNIAEKRVPQDGRIHYNVNNQKVDMRVSSLPCVYGEKIVIRITTALGMKLDKKAIGFLPENLEKFDQLLTSSRGIILLSGATGSGKSTTLYAALSSLNTEDKNIVTVENPVEMVLPGATQVNINEKAGLTFASVLRSILRQDPDIIMIGEIRDQETADIAARAAITGHLVLSTIHTYNAASSVVRLIDMGVEPYMVSSSMLGVIAQKLVRRLCPSCKQAYTATDDELRLLGLPITKQLTLYKAGQCPACNNIGYKGRIAVHEVMPVSRAIKNAIHLGKTTDEIDTIAREEGMISLRDNLKKLLYDGIISFDTFIDTVSEIYQED
ncbi:GspE/PulE family protein [Ruminococcus sp.]|uniref:GspE/PulE family protein n=1 Tax=Ruminococcus sp. TaxID=41978 RepID=UPI003868EEE8